jgi:YVTN family beta-propeller protein
MFLKLRCGIFAAIVTGVGFLLNAPAVRAQSLVAEIPVEESPERMAITPDGTRLFAVGQIDNNITVIDTATNLVLTVIPRVGPSPSGDFPDDILISPDGSRVYVASGGRNTLTVVDTASSTIIGNIAVGDNPSSLALTPDGTKLYVANAASWGVTVIDTTTLTALGTIPAFPDALARTMAVQPNGSRIYLAHGSVTVIDTTTDTVLANIPTDGWRLVISPDGSRLYVHSQFSNRIDVIDTATNTIIATIPLPASGPDPEVIAITADGKHVYATNFNASSVSVIDTLTNSVMTKPFPMLPVGLTTSPDSSTAFIATFGSLSWLDTASNAITTTLPTSANTVSGETPIVSPDGARLYTACGSSVCVFDTGISTFQAVVVDIKPGSRPNSINPGSRGVVPVAVLGDAAFDPALVDVTTVRFGASGTEAAPRHFALEDVDGDGRVDLILQFSTHDTGVQCGDTVASLTGTTRSGKRFGGTDSVTTVGCR